MTHHRLLGISGSLRKEATNTKLVKEAARLFGDTEFAMAEIDLPLYDGDAENASGIPPAVHHLADQITGADAVAISTPEYNKALSGSLKNALDWVSRVKGNPWGGKPVAIMSAAAGRSGGERAQSSLRLCLAPFRPRLVPGPEVLIAASGGAFDGAGQLTNEMSLKTLQNLMDALKAEIEMA